MTLAVLANLPPHPVIVENALPPVEERLDALERGIGALVSGRRVVIVLNGKQVEIEIGVVLLVRTAGSVVGIAGEPVLVSEHEAKFGLGMCPLVGGKLHAMAEQE